MSFLMILVMVACAIGMFVGLSKQKQGYGWGQPFAVVCIVIGICIAGYHMYKSNFGSEDGASEKIEVQWHRIAAQRLGMYLAEKHAGDKVMVILEPRMGEDDSKNRAYVEGLRDGFAGKLEIVIEHVPEIPESVRTGVGMEMPSEGEEGGAVLPPLEFWYTGTIFDKLVSDNNDKIDMVISTVGLPMDMRRMKFWQMKDRPKLAMANGSVFELRRAIVGQAVVAAVTYSPDAIYDGKAPGSNIDEAFNKRFLLVTPESINEVASKYSSMFSGGN